MSGTAPQQPGDDRTADARTRAFLALALGTVGVLGGGVIANALTWLFVDSIAAMDPVVQMLPQALTAAGFGAAALALAPAAATSGDPVAAPTARVGQWLGILAVAGGALLLLAGALN